MIHNELKKTAEMLEHEIATADSGARLKLQPKFSQVLEKLTAEGQKIPGRLRRLDAALYDEAVEARFDNMPV